MQQAGERERLTKLSRTFRLSLGLACLVATAGLGGCMPSGGNFGAIAHLSPRDCLTRAMYFESNRSSEEGMLAVGTVVMNRVESGRYPHSVCGVVGQRGQFASGVLWKRMSPRDLPRVERVADQVLAGARHPGVGTAMFFHTAGYHFPYRNMHYVAVAGGNAFYEKRSTRSAPPRAPLAFASPDAVAPTDPDRLALFLNSGRLPN
jgi:spore germination cell wall hydrolase CwlJ-like protein